MKIMTLDEVMRLPPLSEEELDIIRKAQAVPDEENPALTAGELENFRPWYEVHPKGSDMYKVKVKKTTVCIRIDTDVLEKLKSYGKGYQTRINTILRQAVMGDGQ